MDNNNDNTNSDNFITFEEARAVICSRLNYLRSDLSFRSSVEENLYTEVCKAHKDRKRKLMDIYAQFYAPCRVSDLSKIPKGQGDMNAVMLDFSEGYDTFIQTMEREYSKLLSKRRNATVLLSKILSIKYPYSRVLYLYYYLNMDTAEITDRLFISRSTFYRLKNIGINILTGIYFPQLVKPGLVNLDAGKSVSGKEVTDVSASGKAGTDNTGTEVSDAVDPVGEKSDPGVTGPETEGADNSVTDKPSSEKASGRDKPKRRKPKSGKS